MSTESVPNSEETTREPVAQQTVFRGKYVLERKICSDPDPLWLVQETGSGRRLLLEFLPAQFVADGAAFAELTVDIGRNAELDHPSIEKVYGYEKDGADAAILREFIGGRSLAELREGCPGQVFDHARLEPVMKSICEALSYAHKHKSHVVHGHLDPSRVVVTQEQNVKITGFGTAARLRAWRLRSKEATIEEIGCRMSPQQIERCENGEMIEVADRWDDIYSIGALIFEMLTGESPFASGNVRQRILEEAPPSIVRRRHALGITGREGIPSNWEKAVAGCLAKLSGDRPRNVRELYDILNETRDGGEMDRGQSRSKEARRIWLLLGGAIVLALGAATAMRVTHPPPSTAPAASTTELQSIDYAAMELPDLRIKARADDPVAQGMLAYRHLFGWKAPTDFTEVRRWAERAGEKRDAVGKFVLAYAYWKGLGEPQDEDQGGTFGHQAATLLTKEATPDKAVASVCLALIRLNGIGEKKDVVQAVALLKSAAAQNDAVAQFQLADLYEKGLGVEQSSARALDLLNEAAKQGYTKAQLQLGLHYETAPEGERDFAKAAAWYSKAIDHAEPKAEYRLGRLYESGSGVEKNIARAMDLYVKASDRGDDESLTRLALLYEEGNGVPKNLLRAVDLYSKAAELGNPIAQTNLAWLYENGIGVEKDIVKALDLYTKAAERGYARAQDNLGVLYETGTGVRKNPSTAARLYQKAADQGLARAQSHLALLYIDGNGVDKNLKEAVNWLEKASAANDPVALLNLGILYANGTGVDRNPKKAAELYELAVAQGDPAAETNLGALYEKGVGVAQDLGKAVQLYESAASKNYPRALAYLAWLYEQGIGVEKNVAKAQELYEHAADLGSPEAQFFIAVSLENSKSWEKAVEMYTKAANQGFGPAEYNLGILYLRGTGVEKNVEKATELLQKAADSVPEANNILGIIFEQGLGGERSLAKAAEYYQKAADAKVAEAQYNLGVLYERGVDGTPDLKKATEFYNQAASQKYEPALKRLKAMNRSEEKSVVPR